ncbi:MAG: hypothetical protein ISS18_12945 [Bacteroidales bacterium]|nr:hypothetical protein [Bacteroidales bacterium]
MVRFFLLFLIISTNIIYAQEFVWNKISSGNSDLPNDIIKCITTDTAGVVWIGTYMGGVAALQNDQWTVYNTSNSELSHNYINAIAIDKSDVKWIGTDGGGLAKFDGTNWDVYKTTNSALPSNVVMTIYCDDDGSVWVGTYFGGLVRFDGENWTIFNTENSPLISNKVVAIAKDTNGILWLGTQGGGIASFDGNNWNIYTESNSKLPSDYIYSITTDKQNNKWIGTGGGGVAVFNDKSWIIYNTDNSDLTDDNIRPIIIDDNDFKWIATYIGGINVFDGESWIVFDYQNSELPDDEITCLAYDQNKLFIGTERSGVIIADDTLQKKSTEIAEEIIAVKTTTEIVDKKPEVKKPETKAVASASYSKTPKNKIVLVFDAADVNNNKRRLDLYKRSFKLLLKNREKINDTYGVSILIYSSNFDVNPRKVQFAQKQLDALHAKDVIYLEGETTFTEAIKKAFDVVKADYDPEGNNHVIAATYKFIRDDETAKVVIKENIDEYYIVFSLLAFETDSWKMKQKMRNMIPKGNGHYYSINPVGMKDNWSVTGQFGFSVFRGDIDVSGVISFPGEFGIAFNKKVLSTGILTGGIKGQFNFGDLQGKKTNYSFENKYKEGCLNFQVILNKWFNSNFRFEKFRPYAFAGIGFINYRVLLRDGEGNVINGYGYKITAGDTYANGVNPEKDKPVTDIIFPVGLGINYKLNDMFNIELEASSRFINSDKLDGKVRYKNDKYWFVSLGLTYKFNNKKFLSDILNK